MTGDGPRAMKLRYVVRPWTDPDFRRGSRTTDKLTYFVFIPWSIMVGLWAAASHTWWLAAWCAISIPANLWVVRRRHESQRIYDQEFMYLQALMALADVLEDDDDAD